MSIDTLVSKLVLVSRYRFVTNEEQLLSLISLVEKDNKSLAGLLVILDGNLVVARTSASKVNLLLSQLSSTSKKLRFSVLIVVNPETKLDKRLLTQLTHTSRIYSEELKSEVRIL